MTVALISARDLDHAKAALDELVAEARRRSSIAAAGGDIGEPIRIILDGAAELLCCFDIRGAIEALSRTCRRVGIGITLRDAFARNAYADRPTLGDLGGSNLIGEAVCAGLIQLDWVPVGEYVPLLMGGSLDDELRKTLGGQP